MTNTCIISFGNSRKYRLSLPLDNAKRDLASLKDTVKTFLKNKFPGLEALSFYDKMTVAPVAEGNAKNYEKFPEFNAKSIQAIENTLSTEVEDAESLQILNDNAPWNSIH